MSNRQECYRQAAGRARVSISLPDMLFRRLTLLASAIFVLAAAPAQADITVTNIQAKPADTKAGGHSDFTLSFDVGGSEDIKDLDVNLPAGLLGNPNAATQCTPEQFSGDTCPAASKVGTQTVNVTLLILPTDVSGDVYNLVPHAGEPARLGIILRPPAMAAIKLESPVRVRPEDGGLTSELRNIPADFPINSISLTLQAKAGSGKDFMTNPTSCGPAVTRLHATGSSGGVGDGEGSFTPTACDALPFAPKLSATVGEAGKNGAGAVPPLSTVIEQAPGEANTKSAKVTLLPPLAPNPGALALVCPLANFNADTCPDKSTVGEATVVTPLLATPLKGPVRVIENPGKAPKVALYLNGVINLRLVGDTDVTATGIVTTFAGIPDVPLSRFQLDFNGGTNGLVGTNKDICTNPPTIKGEFTAHSGKTTTVMASPKVVGCPAGGGSTGGGGGGGGIKNLRPTFAASLSRLATSKPRLKGSVKRRTGGKRIRTLSITLPGGLSFDRGKLKVGVVGTSHVLLPVAGKKRIVLKTKSAKGAQLLAATVRSGLVVSKHLRSRVKRHPKVTIVLKATEVGGKAYTQRQRVTVR